MKGKISAAQVFCLLLLSRLAAEFVYPSSGGMGADNLLAALLTEIGRFLAALPIIIFSFGGDSFYAAIKRKNRLWGWISAIAAALLLLGFAVRSALSTAVMAQRTLLFGSGLYLTAGLLAIYAAYGAFKGAEALARAGVLFLIGAGAVTLVVILADIPFMRFDEYSLGVIRTDALAGNIWERARRGGEYLIFAAFLPYIRRENTKSAAGRTVLAFAGISAAAVLCLTLFAGIVLGEFMGLAEFPYTALASMSDIALFKRLDGFFAAVWSLCGAYRCAVMIFGAYAIMAQVIPHGKPAHSAEEAA
ncbi:MAG: hypothetical protein ACI4KM_05005 [Oscillospiraceae bacterium]